MQAVRCEQMMHAYLFLQGFTEGMLGKQIKCTWAWDCANKGPCLIKPTATPNKKHQPSQTQIMSWYHFDKSNRRGKAGVQNKKPAAPKGHWTRMYTHVHTCTHMYTHAHTRTHTRTHTHAEHTSQVRRTHIQVPNCPKLRSKP